MGDLWFHPSLVLLAGGLLLPLVPAAAKKAWLLAIPLLTFASIVLLPQGTHGVVSFLQFTLVFGRVARLPTDGMPPMLFYMTGVVAWSYFATCLTRTSTTFTANAHIFGKVWFPRLIVPLASLGGVLVDLCVSTAVLLVLMPIFGVPYGAGLLAVPLLLLPVLLLALGCPHLSTISRKRGILNRDQNLARRLRPCSLAPTLRTRALSPLTSRS